MHPKTWVTWRAFQRAWCSLDSSKGVRNLTAPAAITSTLASHSRSSPLSSPLSANHPRAKLTVSAEAPFFAPALPTGGLVFFCRAGAEARAGLVVDSGPAVAPRLAVIPGAEVTPAAAWGTPWAEAAAAGSGPAPSAAACGTVTGAVPGTAPAHATESVTTPAAISS
ncbi:MAG: hypothetical protein FRX49_09085 [Trebouxia sp. A1-2]|nr:MAG: hypothetical protein FRX49_09085 [Trebouxia sp. A1-2]